MTKRKLTRDEIEKSIELAFQELLELSTMDLENNSFQLEEDKQKFKKNIKENPIKSNSIEKVNSIQKNSKQTDLKAIISLAKQKGKEINTGKWKDYDSSREDEVLLKAKKEGKSAYDSDVLRELILERQKQKRKTNDVNEIIYKKK
ncbi:hypothetical protein [Spiroplasma taiwanense]|uniref:Uncharacterized protein n=1 Tax=Spiroplasma taiwanense CT-1 TaxID=1276220 RepID=S5LTL6_9MOLU|nr:hypothetical protein [Spiroplasma taiwanense]AGR41054.1 hypothetical protein STAIW_v1c04040 [Spiroplasma taiwanense CT-1]